jgi:antitoxin CptB
MDTLKKRLYYQSQHRGMKEMDMLLGRFAEQHLEHMNHEELQQFEDLLAFSDQALYGWIFENEPLPADAPRELVLMICEYRKT